MSCGMDIGCDMACTRHSLPCYGLQADHQTLSRQALGIASSCSITLRENLLKASESYRLDIGTIPRSPFEPRLPPRPIDRGESQAPVGKRRNPLMQGHRNSRKG
jgi:hypothetical protein